MKSGVFRSKSSFSTVTPTTSSTANDKLLKWLETQKGFSIHRYIEVFRSEFMGAGIRASQKIETGSVIMRVPKQMWIPYSAEYSVHAAKSMNPTFLNSIVTLSNKILPNSPQQADNLIKSSCLATLLTLGRNEPEAERQIYVDFLMKATFPFAKDVGPHPLLRTNKEIDEYLLGTRAHKAIATRRKMFGYLALQLFGGDSNAAAIMRQDFLWAMGIIQSRALSSAEPSRPMPFSLVPGLDLTNHSSSKENAEHRYLAGSGDFELVAKTNIEAGEEVFISYGRGRDSASFLSLYGFCEPNNINDSIALSLMHTIVKPVSTTLLGVTSKGTAGSGEAVSAVMFSEWQRRMFARFGIRTKPSAAVTAPSSSASTSKSSKLILPVSSGSLGEKKEDVGSGSGSSMLVAPAVDWSIVLIHKIMSSISDEQWASISRLTRKYYDNQDQESPLTTHTVQGAKANVERSDFTEAAELCTLLEKAVGGSPMKSTGSFDEKNVCILLPTARVLLAEQPDFTGKPVRAGVLDVNPLQGMICVKNELRAVRNILSALEEAMKPFLIPGNGDTPIDGLTEGGILPLADNRISELSKLSAPNLARRPSEFHSDGSSPNERPQQHHVYDQWKRDCAALAASELSAYVLLHRTFSAYIDLLQLSQL